MEDVTLWVLKFTNHNASMDSPNEAGGGAFKKNIKLAFGG